MTTTAVDLEHQLVLAYEDIEYGKDRCHYLSAELDKARAEVQHLREQINVALDELANVDHNQRARRILRRARVRSGVRLQLDVVD